ncbi:MAG: addiction module protein [Verrucomicrobiota bacterium]
MYPASMLAIDQISQMTVRERVEVMELLWGSFSKDGIDYPSPDWHARILAERSAKIDSGEATFLSLDELQSRLASR